MIHTIKSSTAVPIRYSLKELKAIRLRELDTEKANSKKSKTAKVK